MKTVYTASKSSYGTGFFEIFNSIQELKEGIVEHELQFEKVPYQYSEELFKKHSVSYKLAKIELDDSEEIVFDEYDGQSWFKIQKIQKPEIISEITWIE